MVSVWPDDDAGLLSAVVEYYQSALPGSLAAVGWLERRRIGLPEALETFGVGFSDRTLGATLPVKSRSHDRDVRGRLQALGVLRGSGHEQFRGCVTVPIVDAEGGVVQVYGRTIVDSARLDAGSHRWLPTPRRGVWNLAGLDGDEVIVCEGVVDALSWWCAGFRSVVAVACPGGVDNELVNAVVEAGTRRVVLAFDADPAGGAGAKEAAARFARHGISCARVVPPQGLDVNDVAVRAKHPADALGRLLRQAVWIDSTPPPPSRSSSPPSPPSPLVLPVEVGPDSAREAEAVSVGPPTGLPAPSEVEMIDGELRVMFGQRRWRVRGLGRVSSFDALRVNVLVGVGERFHVDTLDLYVARARAGFITIAAAEVGVDEATVKADLGRVLLACEIEAEKTVRAVQEPVVPVMVELSDVERADAMALLTDPGLIDRVAADLGRVGIVGETSNGVVAYLAAVSRNLDQPLAVVVQSTSAAGKSALVDAVLGLVPPEDLVRYSAMTGQSLFYMGGGDLAHKVLAVAEEEGASRAAYALKLLQSDGELSIASTGKDGTSGRLVTHAYKVQGPTAIFLTTTAIDIDEELLNRCLVLSVDESAAQTRAIHQRQRSKETLAGLVAGRERDAVIAVHRNAQRLLERVAVVNPFAEQLSFADTATRTRRDHAKYLGLIRVVTFLHQHQRERRTVTVDGVEVVYVESTVGDVAVANRVAHEVLGRSLDELPPQTRRLLDLLHGYVVDQTGDGGDRAGVRFTRRQVREAVGWGDTQLKVHLARLVDLELVAVYKPDGGTGHVYGLAWDGQGVDGSRFVIGLTDPATLTAGYDSGRSGSGRGPVGARSGGGRTRRTPSFPQFNHQFSTQETEDSGIHGSGGAGGRVVVVPVAAAG